VTHLCTYAQSKSDLLRAYSHGIRHIILEHSLLSVRSFYLSPNLGLSDLETLITEAQNIGYDDISIQCDRVVHDEHFPILQDLVEIMKKKGIYKVSLQDIDAVMFFKEKIPESKLIFQPDIGFHNHLSFSILKRYLAGIVIGNECPISTIKTILNHSKNLNLEKEMFEYQLQIHGLILLQYSYRRYLGTSKIDYSLAQDHDYKGRYFQFLNNQHGHFMFSYFDRCLLKAMSEVESLGLSHYLIDVRGQKSSYQDAVFNAYYQFLTNPQSDLSVLFDQLALSSPRSLKPGFFRANQTDQDRKKRYEKEPIGQIIDSQKNKYILIQCFEEIKTGQILFAISEEKVMMVNIQQLMSLDGKEIQSSQSNQWVCVPWQKGLKAKLYLYNEN